MVRPNSPQVVRSFDASQGKPSSPRVISIAGSFVLSLLLLGSAPVPMHAQDQYPEEEISNEWIDEVVRPGSPQEGTLMDEEWVNREEIGGEWVDEEYTGEEEEINIALYNLLRDRANCLEYYHFGSAIFNFDEHYNFNPYSTGEEITVKGTIYNDNNYPLTEGRIFARILKQDETVEGEDWHPVIYEEFLQGDYSLSASTSRPFSFTWKIPEQSPEGRYRFEFSYFAGSRSVISGIPYVTNFPSASFSIKINKNPQHKTTSYANFNRGSIKVNSQPFHLRSVPPTYQPHSPITIETMLEAKGNTPIPLRLHTELYKWSDSDNPTPILKENSFITISPSSPHPISFTWDDPKPGAYELLLTAIPLNTEKTPSTLKIRFPIEGNVPRIMFAGIGGWDEGTDEAIIVTCVVNATYPKEDEKDGSTSTKVKVGDTIIGETSAPAPASWLSATHILVPIEEIANGFTIETEARDDKGNITDTYSTTYDPSNITIATPKKHEAAPIQPTEKISFLKILSFILLIFAIIAITVFIFIKRRNKTPPSLPDFPQTLLLGFLFVALTGYSIFFQPARDGSENLTAMIPSGAQVARVDGSAKTPSVYDALPKVDSSLTIDEMKNIANRLKNIGICNGPDCLVTVTWKGPMINYTSLMVGEQGPGYYRALVEVAVHMHTEIESLGEVTAPEGFTSCEYGKKKSGEVTGFGAAFSDTPPVKFSEDTWEADMDVWVHFCYALKKNRCRYAPLDYLVGYFSIGGPHDHTWTGIDEEGNTMPGVTCKQGSSEGSVICTAKNGESPAAISLANEWEGAVKFSYSKGATKKKEQETLQLLSKPLVMEAVAPWCGGEEGEEEEQEEEEEEEETGSGSTSTSTSSSSSTSSTSTSTSSSSSTTGSGSTSTSTSSSLPYDIVDCEYPELNCVRVRAGSEAERLLKEEGYKEHGASVTTSAATSSSTPSYGHCCWWHRTLCSRLIMPDFDCDMVNGFLVDSCDECVTTASLPITSAEISFPPTTSTSASTSTPTSPLPCQDFCDDTINCDKFCWDKDFSFWDCCVYICLQLIIREEGEGEEEVKKRCGSLCLDCHSVCCPSGYSKSVRGWSVAALEALRAAAKFTASLLAPWVR